MAADDAPRTVNLLKEHDARELMGECLRPKAKDPTRFCPQGFRKAQATSQAKRDLGGSVAPPCPDQLGPALRRLSFSCFVQQIKTTSLRNRGFQLFQKKAAFFFLDLMANGGRFFRYGERLELQFLEWNPVRNQFSVVIRCFSKARRSQFAERDHFELHSVQTARGGPVILWRNRHARSILPEVFEIVVLTKRIEENMDDDIAEVQEDPSTVGVAFG